jgi:5-formyltetrahydrofolate cyclo-ligase
MPEEVDLWPLAESALAAGKAVALPRFDLSLGAYGAARILDIAQDVKVGQFGIREPGPECAPMPLNRLDLILVPGLAFDLHGCRLGRGKGFYDRLLAAVCGTTCGVAFEEQMVPQVPVEPHDIKVNCIVAPTRWIEL